MAELAERLKESSSRATMIMATMLNPTIPLPLRILETTHEGRIIRDGLSDGTASTLGLALGLPQRALRFLKENITGVRDQTPLKDQILSQEWITEKLKNGHTSTLALTGRKREDFRSNADHITYAAAELTPLIGSLFIPGVREVNMTRLPASVARVASSIGAQASTAEIAMDSIDWTQDKLGIWAGAPAKAGTSAAFDGAAKGITPDQATKAPTTATSLQNQQGAPAAKL